MAVDLIRNISAAWAFHVTGGSSYVVKQETRGIAARARQARNVAGADRVDGEHEHDRNGAARLSQESYRRISGKWLELLKEIAPAVTRVAVLRDPATAAGIGQFAAIQAVSSPFGVELTPDRRARCRRDRTRRR